MSRHVYLIFNYIHLTQITSKNYQNGAQIKWQVTAYKRKMSMRNTGSNKFIIGIYEATNSYNRGH